MSSGNDTNDDKPARPGFGLGGLAKSLREQADQISKSAKDAVNKAQMNAETLAAKVDQSTPGTKGDPNHGPVQEVDMLGLVPGSAENSSSSTIAQPAHGNDDASTKPRFGSILSLHGGNGGSGGGAKEASSRNAPSGIEGEKKGGKSKPDGTALGVSLSSRTPEEVSKEELLDILQKMNKRVKALSALRVTLTERVKASEKDRSRLVDFLKEEVLTPADVEEASVAAAEKNAQLVAKLAEGEDENADLGAAHKIDEIGMLQMAWRVVDERNSLSLQAIQSEYKNLTLQHQSELEKIREAAKKEKDAEIAKVRAELEVAPKSRGGGDTVRESVGSSTSISEIDLQQRLQELASRHTAEMKRVQQEHHAEMLRVRGELKLENGDSVAGAGPEQLLKEEYEARLKQALEESSAAHESKLKDAKLETAKQVKDAYEKKLSAIKEKAKAFVEKTKKDSSEQVAEAKQEATEATNMLEKAQKQAAADLAERNDELMQLHSETRNSTMVIKNELKQVMATAGSERERYEETIATLKKEREALSDDTETQKLRALNEQANKKLDKVNKELAETSRLLEQTKQKEETAASELEAVQAQAAAAARESEEALGQRLKEALEAQRIEHESSLQSLEDRYKNETTALQGKYDELAASMGKEKDEEVLELRSKVAELEESLRASKEAEAKQSSEIADRVSELESQLAEKDQSVYELKCQTDFAKADHETQLDLVKQELAETSRLLEQTKQKEEAAASELEAVQAQAAAAARESEEALGQRLKEALEAQRIEHESSLQSLEDRYKNETTALQGKYDELAASMGKEKDEEVLELRSKVAELEESLRASKEAEAKQSSEIADRVSELESQLAEKDQSVYELKCQTDFVKADHETQLDLVKQELAETSRLLEQTKQKEEAAASELEAVQAQAAAAARESEEALGRQLKEALEAQRTEHESSLQSLEDRYKNETTALQGKYDELAASMGKEKDEEVLGLRSKVAELEELLRASKEDSVSQLGQVQKELAETSRLLEQTKQKEEAAASELEAVQAQAAAAARESEEALGQRLKEALEAQRIEHESSLQSLEDRYKNETTALQGKYDELAASMGKEKDEEVLELRSKVAELEESLRASKEAEAKQSSEIADRVSELQRELHEQEEICNKRELEVKELEDHVSSQKQMLASEKECVEALTAKHESELRDIRQESNAKLQAAIQKHAKAMDYVKKLKAATAEKLRVIGEEHAAERTKIEEERVRILEDLKKKHSENIRLARDEERIHWEEIVSDLKAKIVSLEEEIAQANECTEREKDERMEADQRVEQRIKEALASAEHERDRIMKTMEEERMKSDEALKAQHLAALEAVKHDRQSAIDRMKEELDVKLKSTLDGHSKAKLALEGKMAKHADELQAFYDGKLNAVISQKDADLIKKEAEVDRLSSQINSLEGIATALREDNESLKGRAKEQDDVQKSLRQRIEELQEEMTINAANNSATAHSLVKEQEALQDEAKVLRGRLSALSEEKKSDDSTIQALQSKVESLSTQVKGLLKEKDDFEEKITEAARKDNKLSAAEMELSALREEVNKLKLNESKSTSLVTRLQSEKEASERKHGQQTALIGMLEAQLAELNESNSDIQAKLEAAMYDILQKDEIIVSTRDQLEKSEKQLTQHASRKAQTDSFAQHAVDKETLKKTKMVEALQKEIQSLQQQMARKSAAAQRLLQEREAECSELRKTNKALQNEVDKGSLSDRRIFELAAQQSSRESVAAAEIELRDKLVQRLAEKLESRDSDLASAEYTVQKVEGQVEELCRVRRREDVNLDYLKSIVVQYLSKPPGSSERAALLPVLATLLQFDASDYEAIEAGKAKLSWWGSIVPTEIAPRTAAPPLSLAAAAAAPPPPPPSKARPTKTSLEF